MKLSAPLFPFLAFTVALTGCAQLMGNLRRDLDDSDSHSYNAPTVGGRWSERNMLGSDEQQPSTYDDHYAAVGHAERNPAGYGLRSQASRRGWLDEPTQEQPQAEEGEGSSETAYSNTPSLPPSTRRLYKNGARATRNDFVDDSGNEGSLWASDGQTNYYFTKNKVRGVGDIVTVTAENDIIRDTIGEVTRSLSPREREVELTIAQERIRAKALGLPDPEGPPSKDQVTASNAAPARSPAAAIGAPGATGVPGADKKDDESNVRTATTSDIDLSRALQFKAGDQIMTEIVERYPNGNYKIRGTKRVPYRNGYRLLSMVGVVKGSDIADDDTVSSGKLYEYRLEVLR